MRWQFNATTPGNNPTRKHWPHLKFKTMLNVENFLFLTINCQCTVWAESVRTEIINLRYFWLYFVSKGCCIVAAMRFAILEMKVCLARIMSQFDVRLSEKTHQPLRLDPKVLFPRVLGGVWVTVQRRTTS